MLAPRAICDSASSLHLAWSSQSEEYAFSVLMPGIASLAPAW